MGDPKSTFEPRSEPEFEHLNPPDPPAAVGCLLATLATVAVGCAAAVGGLAAVTCRVFRWLS